MRPAGAEAVEGGGGGGAGPVVSGEGVHRRAEAHGPGALRGDAQGEVKIGVKLKHVLKNFRRILFNNY